jgi:hypothetical protein
MLFCDQRSVGCIARLFFLPTCVSCCEAVFPVQSFAGDRWKKPGFRFFSESRGRTCAQQTYHWASMMIASHACKPDALCVRRGRIVHADATARASSDRHDAALEDAAAIHVDRAFLSEHAERPLSGNFANSKITAIFLLLFFLSWS